MRKNNKPPRYSIDGFVSHPSGGSSSESVGRAAKRATSNQGDKIDGFVPRGIADSAGSDPESVAETIDLSGDIKPEDFARARQDRLSRVKTDASEPKFWQLLEKRRLKKGKPPSTRKEKIIKRSAIVVGVVLAVILGIMLWRLILAASRVFDGNVLGFFSTTKLRGEDEGRVNILLAGTSEDDANHDGADLTDSIMIASLDTRNFTAFTVSIPRDLWVEYGETCAPGLEGKINATYQCGKAVKFDENGYPKGGMGMLEKVVGESLGIPIHYYGKINYTAFKDAVDAVGGIDVKIDSEDPRGIYDPNIQPKDGGPVRLSNGTHKLDGKMALALARSRNVAGGYGMSRGDFDRTRYQRKMLVALKDKALSVGVLSNPAKVTGLFDAAGDNVETDFKPGEVRRLYDLSKKVQNNKVSSIDLAGDKLNLLTTGDIYGQSIVLPTAGLKDFSDIQRYFKKITSSDPVVREEASIVVLNGSEQSGFAQVEGEKLAEKGLDVLALGNASDVKVSKILINSKSASSKTETRKYLENRYSVTATSDLSPYPEARGYNSDFIVILGSDYAGSSSSRLE